ncbi:MAG: hypothetical protein KJP21_07695 [Bacteroidia bacterium]|nr:hypothetical protein [Bacteroidia bacterium]NNJ54895.1 hypothetical protein [Bacteroidia bacterium]
MISKSDIHQACIDKLQSQIDELTSAIEKVHESVIGEENSTAGNKFETARAMGQEELERLNIQLAAHVKDMNTLIQISATKPCYSVQLGAYIETTKKKLYMCTALGKIEVGKEVIFAVSLGSPIGQVLLGKEKGDSVVFAGKSEKITAIH